jgi:hypothetical protein
MSRSLNLELSDEAYAALRRLAEGAGTSPAEIAARSLESQFGGTNAPALPRPRTEAEKEAARQRFEHHIGEIDLGYPPGADNAAIDADLAREYDDSHH